MSKKFKITSGKGFHLTFPNGYTLSTQFGWGNYGDNYDADLDEERNLMNLKRIFPQSNRVETAFWGANGELVAYPEADGNTVQGYQTMEDWLSTLDYVRNLPKETQK